MSIEAVIANWIIMAIMECTNDAYHTLNQTVTGEVLEIMATNDFRC